MLKFVKRNASVSKPNIEVEMIEGFTSTDGTYIQGGSILAGKLSQDGDAYICQLNEYPGYYLEIKEKNGRWIC